MSAEVAAWVLADLRSSRDLLNRIADLDTEGDAERESYRHMAQGVDVAIESVRDMASSGLVASPAFKTPQQANAKDGRAVTQPSGKES